jgi:dihydrodipicolinate synthase/N-acetylneuraminate lyase
MPDTSVERTPCQPTETSRSASVAKLYHGVVVPMVTPVTPQGDLDEPAVRRVIDHLIEGGVSGIFVLGTTGEAASVPHTMRSRLVATTVEHVGDRAVTYAGIGDNCLAHSIQAAKEYFRLGINAVVAHLPSYYALGPEEQRNYYAALIEGIPGPLMLYNIPITTHMSISIEVVEKLSEHPRVIGLKDSESNVARLEAVIKRLGGRSDFAVLVGVTALSAAALSLGANGMVPSVGNLVPDLCHDLYENGIRGDVVGAEALQRQIDKAADIYRGERTLTQSLAALKAAMGALSLCGPDVLPPLCPLTAVEQKVIQQEFIAWRAEQDRARK